MVVTVITCLTKQKHRGTVHYTNIWGAGLQAPYAPDLLNTQESDGDRTRFDSSLCDKYKCDYSLNVIFEIMK